MEFSVIMPDTIIDMIAPKNAGTACRLSTKRVSWKPALSRMHFWNKIQSAHVDKNKDSIHMLL